MMETAACSRCVAGQGYRGWEGGGKRKEGRKEKEKKREKRARVREAYRNQKVATP